MNKLWVTFLFTITLAACWASSLPVAIDMNRFLNEKSQTRFEINYKIKYKDLSFVAYNKGLFADLTVKIEILKGDSVITQKEFTNRIGVSSQIDAESEQKSYLDKISLVLSGKSYKIRIGFTDPKTNNTRVWNQELVELNTDQTISDIELSKSIIQADTTRFLEKFRRINRIYMVEPSHVFYPVLQDSIFVYYQVYGLIKISGDLNKYEIEYRLLKDKEMIRSWEKSSHSTSNTVNIEAGISLKELPFGLYDLEILVKSGLKNEKSTTFFVLGEIKEDLVGIMPKMEDEIALLKYFEPNSKLISLESLSVEGKKRMINQLWNSIATENNLSLLQWTTQLKDRISYANRYYSHFKPGWESDMGRIYIRMGAPDDIRKEITSDDTKFVQKDFQIWKYANNDRVYVFIDIQMNGNYKMIYAKNDDKERSQANWQRYLGKDFEEDDLEKDTYTPPGE
jgi:GWxTD domain-containing protein